jgi:CRP-like cAMP-binding protein/AraC-like DNA-binding protein
MLTLYETNRYFYDGMVPERRKGVRMARLATPVDPTGHLLDQFAWALRSLRDQMGSGAPSVDEISEREGIPRSTLYAALRGDRLPRREVVAAIARSWGADEAEWLSERSKVESELANQADPQDKSPELDYYERGWNRYERDTLPEYSPNTMALFHAAGSVVRYSSGSRILETSESVDKVLVLKHGIAKETVATSQGPMLLGFCSAGGILGFDVLRSGSRSSSVTAVTPLEVITMSTRDFETLLHGHGEIGLELSRQINARLRSANRRLIDFASEPTILRLGHIFRKLSTRYGHAQPDGSIEISVELTLDELASLIGSSAPSTHEVLTGLRHAGVLEIRHRHIRLFPPRHGSRPRSPLPTHLATSDELNPMAAAGQSNLARRQEAMDYIKRHLADPELTAERIADALFVSRRRLYQIFNDGDGVSSRIRELRIERAKGLLTDPNWADRSVAEVARECGFVNSAHFSRTFHKIVGQTPREFRESELVIENSRYRR